jgi:hypothetical protein
MNEEISNSFMDIDDASVSTMSNGHISPSHQIQNGFNDEVYHLG